MARRETKRVFVGGGAFFFLCPWFVIQAVSKGERLRPAAVRHTDARDATHGHTREHLQGTHTSLVH